MAAASCYHERFSREKPFRSAAREFRESTAGRQPARQVKIMRWSRLFIPTLRDTPSEAEAPSHQLLLRAGYIRQLAAGIYSYLFLAKRSLLKIERIVREEMDAIGAQEFHLPEIHPAEVWRESGRWETMGHDMFRLQDRWGRDLCLGMTEEEVMTTIARGELRSYKQLPQLWYQIQVKFRDEPRPKSGLMRVRRFTMKDSYSFDIDAAGLEESYQKHDGAYRRIFSRSGLNYLAVEAHSGAMGGSKSHEFVLPSDAGEDVVAVCGGCGYAANLEKADSTRSARRGRPRRRGPRPRSSRPRARRPSPRWPPSTGCRSPRTSRA